MDLCREPVHLSCQQCVRNHLSSEVRLDGFDLFLLGLDSLQKGRQSSLGTVRGGRDQEPGEQLGDGGDPWLWNQAGSHVPDARCGPPKAKIAVHVTTRTAQNTMLTGEPIASDTQSANRWKAPSVSTLTPSTGPSLVSVFLTATPVSYSMSEFNASRSAH